MGVMLQGLIWEPPVHKAPQSPELLEITDLLKQQQTQNATLSEQFQSLQNWKCLCCNKPGHIAASVDNQCPLMDGQNWSLQFKHCRLSRQKTRAFCCFEPDTRRADLGSQSNSVSPGLLKQLVGQCSVVNLVINGADVPSLLDTASNVATVKVGFFFTNFDSDKHKLNNLKWLNLTAANGLSITYLGYVELDVTILGRTLPGCGMLSKTNPVAQHYPNRRRRFLGCWGCMSYSAFTLISMGSTALPCSLFPRSHRQHLVGGEQCFLVENEHSDGNAGQLQVWADGPLQIISGTTVVFPATGPKGNKHHPQTLLLEPDNSTNHLSAGLHSISGSQRWFGLCPSFQCKQGSESLDVLSP